MCPNDSSGQADERPDRCSHVDEHGYRCVMPAGHFAPYHPTDPARVYDLTPPVPAEQ